MKAYFTFFRIRLIHSLQYRTAAWAGVATQFFWGFMEIQLYTALHAEHGASFPMELSHLASYIWLRQAFLAVLNSWTFENEIFDMIHNGNVAYELCRPASVYGMWFVRSIAVRISRAALRFWPILLVAVLLPSPWGINAPASMSAFVCFVVSMVLGLCVTVSYTMIVYGSCFFTISSDGIRAILLPITDLLAGGIIPLPFMPEWLSRIAYYSPFGAILNAPLRIYSGDIAGAAIAEAMLLQVFWLIVLVLIGKGWMNRAEKKVVVQGG